MTGRQQLLSFTQCPRRALTAERGACEALARGAAPALRLRLRDPSEKQADSLGHARVDDERLGKEADTRERDAQREHAWQGGAEGDDGAGVKHFAAPLPHRLCQRGSPNCPAGVEQSPRAAAPQSFQTSRQLPRRQTAPSPQKWQKKRLRRQRRLTRQSARGMTGCVCQHWTGGLGQRRSKRGRLQSSPAARVSRTDQKLPSPSPFLTCRHPAL